MSLLIQLSIDRRVNVDPFTCVIAVLKTSSQHTDVWKTRLIHGCEWVYSRVKVE